MSTHNIGFGWMMILKRDSVGKRAVNPSLSGTQYININIYIYIHLVDGGKKWSRVDVHSKIWKISLNASVSIIMSHHL